MSPREGGVITEDMVQEEVEGLQLMMVRRRNLSYPVFDADNHLYETPDALTKFLPDAYKGLVKYLEVNIGGKIRTRIAVDDHIAGFIPNPTFTRVAPPGGPKQRSHAAAIDRRIRCIF